MPSIWCPTEKSNEFKLLNMKKVVIILQARTDSARLPAKGLLPICGVPMAVLAAARAGNKGGSVLVATTSREVDDELCKELERAGVAFFRGATENVLQRFVDALASFCDSTIVVRLTADNVIPDGAFVERVVTLFIKSKTEYLSTGLIDSGLPHGLSVEVTYARNLRLAAAADTSSSEREHVTPYLKKRFGVKCFNKYSKLKLANYSCTVDTLAEYFKVRKLFEGVQNPVNESWKALVRRLVKLEPQPLVRGRATMFVLGGAQLGMNYGLFNQRGSIGQEAGAKLLAAAHVCGVKEIDLAQAYGESELVYGEINGYLRGSIPQPISKLSPDAHLCDSPQQAASMAQQSVLSSLRSLGLRCLPTLLLHRAEQYSCFNGAIWKALLAMRAAGFISRLGVSVCSPREALPLIADPDIEVIQAPLNILDHRWEIFGEKVKLEKQKRVIQIYSRSALLQGLLPSSSVPAWRIANVDGSKAEAVVDWLRATSSSLGRASTVDLCFAFVRALPWVDRVVVGVDDIEQLTMNLRYFERPRLSTGELEYILESRPILQTTTLDPSQWKPTTTRFSR
jgi:spore coat polysaccharide biosynthesis protein SpsF (cytidylyltransferase family)/aryl-alcohol dehydrogenase-like predicted oxidoreductase